MLNPYIVYYNLAVYSKYVLHSENKLKYDYAVLDESIGLRSWLLGGHEKKFHTCVLTHIERRERKRKFQSMRMYAEVGVPRYYTRQSDLKTSAAI